MLILEASRFVIWSNTTEAISNWASYTIVRLTSGCRTASPAELIVALAVDEEDNKMENSSRGVKVGIVDSELVVIVVENDEEVEFLIWDVGWDNLIVKFFNNKEIAVGDDAEVECCSWDVERDKVVVVFIVRDKEKKVDLFSVGDT